MVMEGDGKAETKTKKRCKWAAYKALGNFSHVFQRGEMRKKTLPLIFAVLVICSIVPKGFAVTGRVEGYVRDAHTQMPLVGATVLLVGTSMGAVTNEDGRYIISDVPVGRYKVRASYVGYKNQELSTEVGPNVTARCDFMLQAVGVKGEEVVVTAQATGQNSAINQQLSSDQIVNVVSAARIRELPDANAAESIGRLPGISLVREGGEGAEVVIRGLAPEYNKITINGVEVPPNVSSSRAVDLSDISSNMLGGIEVVKAITPDMDAAALGGVVDLKLREAQASKSGTLTSLLAQGGYNALTDTHSDYKFVGTAESRFFNDRFGVFAEMNVESRNLTANTLGAAYYLNGPQLGKINPAYMQYLSLTDIPRYRQRYGAEVTTDYSYPTFKVDFMNFYSSAKTQEQNRNEAYDLVNNTHSYSTTDDRTIMDIVTNLLYLKKDFPLFSIDAKLAHSYSQTSIPNALTFSFLQTNVGLNNTNFQLLNPQAIPTLAKNDLTQTYFQTALETSSLSRNRQLSAQVDLTSNMNFSRNITSVMKFGGAYKYTIKSYRFASQNTRFQINGIDSTIKVILNAFPWMQKFVPMGSIYLPITLFEDPSFSYGNFLDGDFKMGPPLNVGLMHQVMNVVNQAPPPQSYDYLTDVATNDFNSITNNYNGYERESAVYAMYKVNFGQAITFLPGVRFQQLSTIYTAPRGIQTPLSYEYHDTTIEESHGFWLPMVHLIARPLSWLQVHLAYTNTLNYPPFNAITPRINIGYASIIWNNYALKPAHSTNYDAILSIYNNSVGLLTVDGFLKHIRNLIFPLSTYVVNPADYAGIPDNTKGMPLSTYINDPYVVNLWGTEVDWETHLWYLPGPLSGLVLSANYTHIYSLARYPLTTVTTIYLPRYRQIVNDTFYTDRMIYQPKDMANLAIGYDLKQFSMRLSLLFQSNVFYGANFWPELREYGANYLRWDLAVKQGLPWLHLRLFFDLNNINDAKDLYLNGGSSFPQSEEFYGMTAAIGLEFETNL